MTRAPTDVDHGVREAASVILLRPAAGRDRGEPEVLLVQRRRKASFMASAWVFPGGALDPEEHDPREAAIRELFEEAGVLLAHGGQEGELESLRRRVLDGQPFRDELATRGRSPEVDALHYFSHWITPSIEAKRFSARFYVAQLPDGQRADTGAGELDDACWLAPTAALERAAELRLPPPQLRTLRDLRELGGIDEILAACRARAAHPHPILPRAAQSGAGFALLLPWDPDYDELGQGDALPMPADHPLAEGPSRFILEDATWKHVDAPR
jgi:8-oxo-dGTP pyrophosphatase MutT (NUDIX family)